MSEENGKTAEDYLHEALQEMRQRAASRDTPGGERSMGRCVAAFNVLYREQIIARINAGLPPLSETLGWQFASILKKSRGAVGRYREDDYTDDVAYAALAAESATRDATRHTLGVLYGEAEEHRD